MPEPLGIPASAPGPSLHPAIVSEGPGIPRGASEAEWLHLACDLTGLGLHEHLVPVVAEPSAEPSPRSSISDFSKTPSRFNALGQAVGIPKWPQHRATMRQVQGWIDDGRLGCAIVCRLVRAIDIDVPEPALARQIADFADDFLGLQLPRRVRSNSGKLAMLVIASSEDPLGKADFTVKDGAGKVEFLGDRQILVVAGTHTSGVRYQCEGGLPAAIPEVPLERYLALMPALDAAFGVGDLHRGAVHQPGQDIDADDPVANILQEQGLVIGGDQRKLFIRCPWEAQHSKDSGPSETAWLLAGTGGHSVGHFECRHASCSTRSDSDFFEAIGYAEDVSSDFEALPAVPAVEPTKPASLIVNGDGTFPSTISNITYALEASAWTGVDIGFDEFLGEVMFCPAGGRAWRVLGDDDRAELRLLLERSGFRPIKREDLRDAVRIIARMNKFDSAQQWLDGIKWDGRPRVETFLIDHFGTADTPYTRAVSRYWWTAQAARILHPGCQVDMVPVLVSPEGRYKSTTLQALVPSLDHFTEIDLATSDDNLARQMRGKLLGELGELKGLNKRETADLKAKITSRFEEWSPKYVEGVVRYLRRLVFVGTTNEDQFMAPAIGKRRWLPVAVNGANPAKLVAMRDQLWSEAAEIVRRRVAEKKDGEVEWEAAYRLAPAEREHFEAEDPWTTGVDHWIENSDPKPDEFTTDTAFCAIFSAFDRIARNPTPNEQSRMSEILKARGFKQVRKSVNGRKRRVWTTAGPEREPLNGPIENRSKQPILLN